VSFLRATGSQWRTPELGKNVIVSSWRGITRVQRWPKKVGPPRNENEAKRRKIFALYQLLIKWIGSKESEYERQAILDHNRTHRGQRGSAAIRFRDWQTQRLYGRCVAITTDSGIVFYPPAVSRDASFILDHATAEHGAILQRTVDKWGAIAQGSPGDVLITGSIGQSNSWFTLP
jgi:hypothetical protein